MSMIQFVVLAVGILALLPTRTAAQVAEAFRTRNLNPPVAIFALPTWQPIPARATAGATLELANHYRLSRRGDDFLLLDGETVRLNLHAERRFGSVWSVGLEIPLVRQFGGVLDNAIDGWHSTFGLPDGGRNGRPQDVIEFQLGRGTDRMIELTRSNSSVGDAVVSVAREVGSDGAYTLRASTKLATGDEASLSGSGSTDWMVTLLRQGTVSLAHSEPGYYWGIGVVMPGRSQRIRLPAEDVVLTGLAGGGMPLGSRFGLRAQIEVHTPFYDTPLEELGQTAVQVSFGGWWTYSQRARLDFAVSEDLHVSTAPDVVIHAGVQWLW